MRVRARAELIVVGGFAVLGLVGLAERDRVREQLIALRFARRPVGGRCATVAAGVRRVGGRGVTAAACDERDEQESVHDFDVSVCPVMALWFAAVLGLVQGLTEYIPVSSTAHLMITRALFGQHVPIDAYKAYIAVIQLGTLAAVLIYFAKDLVTLATAMFRAPESHDAKLPWMLALGTLPIVVLGLLLKSRIENDLNSLYLIAGALIVVGIAMAFIDRGASATRPLSSLTYTDALLVGMAQTLALIPGVSRSGSTICMALLLGFVRSDAARFSFLLSIPAVGGAGILEASKAFRELGAEAVPAIAVGTGVAAVVGYATIAWLMRWLGSHHLIGFAVYRIACGVALLGALAAGFLRSV